VAELLARDRERGTGHPAREQIKTFERPAVHVGYVTFDDLPLSTSVTTKGLAGVNVYLNHCLMGESSLLQAERLSSGACTDLQAGQLAHKTSPTRPTADSARRLRKILCPTPARRRELSYGTKRAEYRRGLIRVRGRIPAATATNGCPA
jgi:hypothetical protein